MVPPAKPTRAYGPYEPRRFDQISPVDLTHLPTDPQVLRIDEPRAEGLWNYDLKSSHRVNKRLPQVSQDLGQPQPQPPRLRLGPVGPTG